jgi:hypothetical protein
MTFAKGFHGRGSNVLIFLATDRFAIKVVQFRDAICIFGPSECKLDEMLAT